MERPSSQRGSAIIMLFIAVALFGMLAYAFSQGTRSGLGWVDNERGKAATTSAQDCTNAINLALKRLELRGCGTMISSATDGSNSNPGAPTDGSCSVFHTNGGGVKACAVAPPSSDPCKTGPIGATCLDGAFYIGDVGSNRIYANANDAGTNIPWQASPWPGTSFIGSTSSTDGVANTNFVVALDPVLYQAAQLCRVSGSQWYLPAKDELDLLWQNQVALDLATRGIDTSGAYSAKYWSSTWAGNNAWIQSFQSGFGGNYNFPETFKVRCVRR